MKKKEKLYKGNVVCNTVGLVLNHDHTDIVKWPLTTGLTRNYCTAQFWGFGKRGGASSFIIDPIESIWNKNKKTESEALTYYIRILILDKIVLSLT